MKQIRQLGLTKIRLFRSLLAAISALMITGHAYAIPISYDESVNGDLNGSQNLALGVGLNTVMGTITFSNNIFIATDFDIFDFSVAVGSSLTTITIDIALLPVGSGVFSSSGWRLNEWEYSEGVAIPSTGLSLFTAALPLSSGNFNIANYSLAGSLPADTGWRTAAYTMSLDVTAVPEPSILALMSVGLIGLIGVARRKKA